MPNKTPATKRTIFYGAMGVDHLQLPAGWQQVDTWQQADAILVDQSQDTPLDKFLQHKPLNPVIRVSHNSVDDLQEKLRDAAAILEQLASLPDVVLANITADSHLLAAAFAWSRNRRIETQFDGFSKLGYCTSFSYLREDADVLIDQLIESGYLEREIIERVHPCPVCQSIKVVLRDACPKCDSINIEDQPLIHHFSCSYQGAESTFIDPMGDYTCPKCRKQLRHFGKDYDKPGEQTVCLSCHYEGHATRVRGRCLGCQHQFPIEKTSPKRLYSYFLNDAGVHALFQGDFNIYNIAHLLAKQLHLLTIDQLVTIGRKFAAVEERHNFHSLLLEIDFSALDARETAVTEKITLMTRVGRELAQLVRPTDSVAYHMGSLLLLMPGADQQAAAKVTQRLRNSISELLDSAAADEFRFSSQSVNEFFSRHV